MTYTKHIPVKDLTPPVKFYSIVVEHLQNGESLGMVSKKLGISKQLLHYRIYPLKVAGIIEHLGNGTWEINKEKYGEYLAVKTVKKRHPGTPFDTPNALKSFPSNTIRGHAFQFVLKIPKFSRWNERKQYLKKKGFQIQEKIKNRVTMKLEVDNVKYKLWLCKNSIVVYFPKGFSFFNEFAKGTELEAVYLFKRIIKRLESLLNISLRIGSDYQFRCSKKEFSLIMNELAKKYNKEKKNLYIADLDGVWGKIDDSFNLNEFEVIRKPKGRDQAEVTQQIVGFFNDMKDHPENPVTSEIWGLSTKNTEQISQVVGNQQFHEANIKSHVEAIQVMSTEVKSLSSIVKEFKPRNTWPRRRRSKKAGVVIPGQTRLRWF